MLRFIRGADKPSQLRKIMNWYCVESDQVAYIGDALNDLSCMQLCSLSACPADAVEDIRQFVDYKCTCKGGCGAVREFIDYLQRL